MKAFIALCSFLVASSVVQAAQTYDFSYTMYAGPLVTGSFTGDANGNLITNLSDVSVNLDGTPFLSGGVGVGLMWAWRGTTPSASFNGLDNNFFFGKDNTWFYSVSAGDGWGSTQIKFAGNNYHGETFVASNWHVVAVPEPETYAMLMAGLGLMGGIARRRKAKQA